MKYKEIDILIGEKLKSIRNRKGYSTRYVGERLGKSNAAITYYETGRNSMDLSTLKKLCNIYDVDFIQFMEDIYEDL